LLQANELGADETNSLTVALDKESIKNSVNSFVEAYNSFTGISNELSKFNGAGAANGPLFGDSTLRTLETQLRRALTDAVPDNSLGNLTELGITTDENGLLQLDDTKLNDAIENDFEAIGGLLSGEEGIANQLREVTRNYKGFSGIIQDRANTLTDQLDDISGDRRKLKTKMEAFEIRLIDRFIIMDQLVNSMKNTGDFVLQQLGALNGDEK